MLPKDLHALLDIVYSAEKVIRYVEGVSQSRFMVDEQLQDAVIRRLLIVGEAAGRISEAGREALNTVEWTEVRGLRNRLVHEYDDISLQVIWEITQTEMTDLISKIKPLIPPDDQLSVLSGD